MCSGWGVDGGQESVGGQSPWGGWGLVHLNAQFEKHLYRQNLLYFNLDSFKAGSLKHTNKHTHTQILQVMAGNWEGTSG